MTFCEQVNPDGTKINPSKSFIINKKGGFLLVHVELPKDLNSSSILLDMFYLNPESGKEEFENSIRMQARPDWTWFSKEITFFRQGKYTVYAYDDRDQLLSAGTVQIAFQ